MLTKKILSGLILTTAAISFSSISLAGPLNQVLTGGGCVITDGDYADATLSFTAADLVAAHGTIAPGDVITHAVTFTPDYGVTDASCADATVAITLTNAALPATGSVSFDSLSISGPGTTAASVVNNTNTVTVTLTMTAQSGLGLASPFTYSVPFSLHADVLGN